MPFWVWIGAGIFLLAIELALVDLAFYLVFLGLAAILVGIVAYVGPDVPIVAQWALFAAAGFLGVIFFRGKVYQKLRGNPPGYALDHTGEMVLLGKSLSPGEKTRVEHRGTTWTAINIGTATIPGGKEANIAEVDGLTLKLKYESD